MNILSFDVGIQNLSYCKLNEDRKIIDWGIINLNDGQEKCDVKLRKQCSKIATYKVLNEENIQYCCTAHKKRFQKVKKIRRDNDLLRIATSCIQKLKGLDTSDVGSIFIENQPALKNPIMKSIQMMIYTYFIMNGIIEENSSIKRIKLINARNKLKVYHGEPIECHKKDKYAKNKYLAIEYTKKMILNEEKEFIELFNQSKKKDDLADAYLQGIYCIEKEYI
tara:strand:- start:217 stop:882 length:666 start_codon:yes stop_codon:yes gene_type:complete